MDLDRAVSAGAWGSFLHQGQICMTTGRHLVHEAIYDEYVARLAGKASHLPVGDPATGQVALGPVIDERQRDKVHGLVTESVDGRRPAGRGRHATRACSTARPCWPTSPRQMPAYASEVFGPVAPVLRFTHAEEAAKLAADSEYGLSLGILTRDVMRGLELARQIPDRDRAHQRADRRRRAEHPVRRDRRLRHRRQVRRGRLTWRRSPIPAG